MGELNETQRYLIDEHIEEYQEGLISRRELLRRVTLISGSAAIGAAIVAACGPAPARTSPTPPPAAATQTVTPTAGPYATPPPQATTDGVTVKPDDPRIMVSKPELKGADGANLMAYMARPALGVRAPGVVVIHENRGQTPHIQDVVRRVATAGFVAINIDLVARAGGYEKLTDQAAYNAELGKLTPAGKLADHAATIAFLKRESSGQIGVTGFCFGGGETWSILTSLNPDVKAAVPYYGPQPANYAELAKTKAAVYGVYAEMDTRITSSMQQMDQELKKSGAPYKLESYPAVNHAFHNDTGTRYDAAAAQKAWVATIEWFRKYLV
ncbi:MAG TPA: dienelactone hydrolase family protein [Candidatus Limnocylindria bacterium]|nr:dienelactone hydrolase family protein [Candidatus Limnocylindria bacterium]